MLGTFILLFVPVRVARTGYVALNITASHCMCATCSGVGPVENVMLVCYRQDAFMDAKHRDTSLLGYVASFPVGGLRS